ncbi:hypothetical protein CL3_08620 [butyrate-producing bacterium SM4/1]|nr:hypothetical protein CLS_11720 [[Clostridium] cf. saccharolyticum K10]CBL35846.1 hypothetical protein CL3_08620 [butyrate-producing bacterium SM4/1]
MSREKAQAKSQASFLGEEAKNTAVKGLYRKGKRRE